jgi:hypothetical protein
MTSRRVIDDFPPGDFGIDDGLAPAPAVVDHHNEILHSGASGMAGTRRSISENQKLVNQKIRQIGN